jgi:hypothetical protein
MKSIKNARALAWQHEFDLVDDEIEGRRMSRNRAHRAALHRARGASVQMLPPSAPELPEQMAAMPRVPMTRHAARRLKDRGISLAQVLVIADFGVPQRSHGATRYALDRKSRQLLVEAVSPAVLQRVGSLDIVAVFSDDGALITATHRTERLRREIARH